MTASYSLVGDSRGQTLTVVFSDGEVTNVPSSHANFARVLGYLVDTPLEDQDETHIKEQLDLILAAGSTLTELSERVSVNGNDLYFDGDKIDSALAGHIVNLIQENDKNGWLPLVRFMEKLATNPSQDSQKSLYSWISGRNLTITEDGDFVAYKGVALDREGRSLSIHSGAAFVDGTLVRGQIPNDNGSVITMPRTDVNSNTGVGCSTGLHAGTWDYASSFAQGRVLEVHINPRDVVSVPDDCAHQKLRVSRYTVVDTIEQPHSVPTVYDDVEDDEEEPEDDYWGDGEEDDTDPDWEAAWSHDDDGEVRAEFNVEEGEYPDDVVAELIQDHGYSLDEALDAVWPDGR